MSLSIGIIGLPNVGKSTLFNALLKRQAALAANYPFATIEPNIGIVDVPDKRIDRLVEIVKKEYTPRTGDREVPEKIIGATVKFYDIAGLVKGAAQGEGLGNAFLGHIKEVDALVHVVRDFKDENIIRAGAVTPAEDISIINTELILSDLAVLDKLLPRFESEHRAKRDDSSKFQFDTSLKVKENFNKGLLGIQMALNKDEIDFIKTLNFLTFKPVIYAFNIDESLLSTINEQTESSGYKDNTLILNEMGAPVTEKIFISAKIESELASISDPKEKQEFLDSLNIHESGLDKIIRKGYDILGLQTFFTIGPKEVHAWTIKKGSTAPQAAGKIHTDFERGFISAQVIGYRDLDSYGSEKEAKSHGAMRLEGKSYLMQDGDIVEFNFSV